MRHSTFDQGIYSALATRQGRWLALLIVILAIRAATWLAVLPLAVVVVLGDRLVAGLGRVAAALPTVPAVRLVRVSRGGAR